MTTSTKKKTKADAIDTLVETMDKYFFRLHAFDDMAHGLTDIKGSDFPENLSGIFRTAELRKAEERFEASMDKLGKVLSKDAIGILDELEGAHQDYLHAFIE